MKGHEDLRERASPLSTGGIDQSASITEECTITQREREVWVQMYS